MLETTNVQCLENMYNRSEKVQRKHIKCWWSGAVQYS